MNGPETLAEKFTRYTALHDEGVPAADICKKMSRDFLDYANMIAMMREIFGLSREDVSRIIVICEQDLYGPYFLLKEQGKSWEAIFDSLKKEGCNFIQIVYILTTPLQFNLPLRSAKQRFYGA